MKYVVAFSVIFVLATFVWFYSVSVAALPKDAKATLIVVEKHKHLMTVYSNEAVLRIYHVALGRGDAAAKQREGDDRTPEGRYTIDARNELSSFHKSLHISYPSIEDYQRAKVGGYLAGGAVMIHGLRSDLAWLGALHRLRDWTRGCVAVTNAEMDELWSIVPLGAAIEIRQ